jgi:hypothetical protein
MGEEGMGEEGMGEAWTLNENSETQQARVKVIVLAIGKTPDAFRSMLIQCREAPQPLYTGLRVTSHRIALHFLSKFERPPTLGKVENHEIRC